MHSTFHCSRVKLGLGFVDACGLRYVVLKALLLIRTGAAEEGTELMRRRVFRQQGHHACAEHLIVCSLKAKNVDDAFVTEVIIECLQETGDRLVSCRRCS